MNLDYTVCALSSANGLRLLGALSLLCIQSVFFVSEARAQSMQDDSLEKTVEESRVAAFRLAEPSIAEQLTSVGERFSQQTKTVKDPAALRQLALAEGLKLWAAGAAALCRQTRCSMIGRCIGSG